MVSLRVRSHVALHSRLLDVSTSVLAVTSFVLAVCHLRRVCQRPNHRCPLETILPKKASESSRRHGDRCTGN
jgi:hypothetical protein